MQWVLGIVGGALALWATAITSPDLMSWLTELFMPRIP
jgi:hypothetical protein